MDIEKITASRGNYFTADQAKAYYGVPRSVTAIVIHHWNDPAARGSFSGNLDYLLHNGNSVSANAVIGYDEAHKKARIIDTVPYPNVAFTTGGRINAQSVAIECDPWGQPGQPHREEVLKAIGYRVYKWRKQFGHHIPLHRHRDYQSTSCPGNYDLAEIDRYADKWAAGGYDPKPAPKPKPTPAPTPKPANDITYHKLATPIVFDIVRDTQLWDFAHDDWSQIKSVQAFTKGAQVTAFGYANHPHLTEKKFYMTKYSFGTADKTGKPDHTTGFNEVDLKEHEAPKPPDTPEPPVTQPPVDEPPTPEPTPTPEPIPDPTTPDPVPSPVPEPDYGKENNGLLHQILDLIKGLIAKITGKS